MRIIRKRLRRFGELTPAERRLLGRALVVVAIVRAALWVAPLKAVRKIAEIVARGVSNRPLQKPVDQIVWAVAAASRYIPKASCLTQAIAGQALLAHAGCPSRIDVGVAKTFAKGTVSSVHTRLRGRSQGFTGGDREDCPLCQFGVAKNAKFEAHAWLVAGSEIVLGAQESSLYERILALD